MSERKSLFAESFRYRWRRLVTRHPLTGERLWRIRLKLWFWETFRV